MAYILELEHLFAIEALGVIFELLFVTTCLSTILYFMTNNQFISLLAAPTIFYFISSIQYYTTHLFFLLVAMLIQGIIIVTIQYQSSKKPVSVLEDRLSSF